MWAQDGCQAFPYIIGRRAFCVPRQVVGIGSSAALGKRVLVSIPAKVPYILEGTLVGIRKFPNEAKLYKIVMASDYSSSIHKAEVWHIARL